MVYSFKSSSTKRSSAIFLIAVAAQFLLLINLFLSEQSLRNRLLSNGPSVGAPHSTTTSYQNTKKDDTIHVVILSNRLVAMAVAIGSVCRTSNDKIHFHVFSTDKHEFYQYFDKLQDCRGSTLEIETIDEATDTLLRSGFRPIWWMVDQGIVNDTYSEEEGKQWAVQTPYKHDKHAHALNLLRFYLPYIPSLSTVDKFVFLDDDVVLQRDLKELLAFPSHGGVAMTAGCQHWFWNSNVAGNFEASWNMSVLETKYIGNHGIDCDSEQDQTSGCLMSTLERDLATLSQVFDPNSKFGGRPLDRQAFNMGLNVFDNTVWKEKKLSHRFEQWVEASNNLRLFPLDTLAFGLCLAYLALGDTVQCYEPGQLWHMVGMAFISQEAYEAAGWPLPRIHSEAYALHYNGAGEFDILCCQPTFDVRFCLQFSVQL